MTKLIINGDHLTSAEWDVLGDDLGRMRYESEGAYGSFQSTSFATVREAFRLWPAKPRIFRQYEGGEIEITKDVWSK